ncbi:glycosyltransferase [Roseateles sp.]|uniref:glycosyltransferase n=1 Tax=Roseateles sp. TaxID=1971397 RepID=UPI0032654000
MTAILVVPSLKISGGIGEALRLLSDISKADVLVLSMWRSPHPMESPAPIEHLSCWKPVAARAPADLIPLFVRFAKWRRQEKKQDKKLSTYIFTHYSTLPLALLVPKQNRIFFVQGIEWRFVKNPVVSWLLKRLILASYRSGRIITANQFLTAQMQDAGLTVASEMPIWASSIFKMHAREHRDIDYAMVLRKGEVKRLDLYRDFLAQAFANKRNVCFITPEDEVAAEFSKFTTNVLLRPSAEQMRDFYARSRCFIHLSDHEGFGLPPLEAMGAGCVPVCRDSGGIRAFLQAPLSSLIFPKSLPADQFFAEAEKLLNDAERLNQLSEEVRQAFDIGLASSLKARGRLINTLT